MKKRIFILDFASEKIQTTKISTGISSVDVGFVPSKKSHAKSQTSQNLGSSYLNSCNVFFESSFVTTDKNK